MTITNPKFTDAHNRILSLLIEYFDTTNFDVTKGQFPTTTQLFEYVVTNGMPATGFTDILFVLKTDNRFKRYGEFYLSRQRQGTPNPDPLEPGQIWTRVPRVPTFIDEFKL